MNLQDMNAKDIVREKYPEAEAEYQEAVFEHGRSDPKVPAKWVVYSFRRLGATELGTGATEEQAWTNASTTVLKELPKSKGRRITREKFDDAGKVGGGPSVEDDFEEVLRRGEPVIIEEPDGTETELELDEDGKIRPRLRPAE